MRKITNLIGSPRLMFAVALGVRVILGIHLLGSGTDPFATNEPSHIAAHIAAGEGFSAPYYRVPVAPTAQQPPGYPLMLAAVFAGFGVYSRTSFLVITAINAVMGAIVSPLIYFVGRSHLSPVAGVIAGWVWAIWPTTAAGDLFLYNYSASTVVFLIWLLALPRMPERKSFWVLFGVGAGAAGLLNPMLLLLFIAGYPWLVSKPKQTALAIVVTGLVLAPWVVRNYVRLGHVYPLLRDNLGLELYVGNHAGMEDHPQPCSWRFCQGTANYNNADFPSLDPRLFAALGEPAFMEKKEQDALAYIQARPGKFVIRTGRRFVCFWLLPSPVFGAIVLMLALVGIFRCPAPFRRFVLVILAIFPVVFYITQISWVVGYRHPLEPLLFLLAAEGVVGLRAGQLPHIQWG